MRDATTILALLGLIASVNAAVHELIVGTFGTASLYTLEFDDQSSTLSLKANTSVSVASSWLALSVCSLESYCSSCGLQSK